VQCSWTYLTFDASEGEGGTGSWKNMGAADSKESMDSFKEGHPVFEN